MTLVFLIILSLLILSLAFIRISIIGPEDNYRVINRLACEVDINRVP